jgi:membrane protein involved in D-alanine export
MEKSIGANWRSWADDWHRDSHPMTPYADSLYFGLLLYVAAIAIALGLAGTMSWRWVLAINAAMLISQYADLSQPVPAAAHPLGVVAGYGLYQWALARAFLWLRQRGSSAIAFRATLVLVLLPLLAVKLLPVRMPASAVAFLGISYATFRSLDVIICIQDRLIASLSPIQYFAYLLFFPTVSAGPLDRYRRFVADFTRRRTRAVFLGDLDGGIHRIFRGLAYKFILAAIVKTYWLDPASSGTGVLNTVSYMYAYAFYLFFDFAGYSAFAIGVGYLLGIHTPENFDRPFLARNIVDFWNRWHISLSTWFRDHVYMRFIMAGMRKRWFGNKVLISCLGFYVSFVLMGMWHGLAVRYLVYGLYHGTLMAGYTVLMQRRKNPAPATPRLSSTVVSTFVTFHLVCFGLLIFSGRLG